MAVIISSAMGRQFIFAVPGMVNSRFPIAGSGFCCAKVCRKGPVIEKRLDAVEAICYGSCCQFSCWTLKLLGETYFIGVNCTYR